jgi:hypothetical protein
MSNLSEVFHSPLYPMNYISNCIEDNYYENEFQHGEMHDIMEDLNHHTPLENSQLTDKDENDDKALLYIFKPNENQGDNFNLSNFATPENFEKKDLNEKNFTFSKNIKTNATSKPFIGKKKKKPEEITFKISGTIQNTTKNNNCGRKLKKSEAKGNHDKFAEDNIMRKIKSNFLDYAHKRINDSFKNKKYQFIKLFPQLNELLKKDYNLDLMKRTFKDLYENSPISSKFRKKKLENSDLNKRIIQEIYSDIERKEFDVISLLDLTYLDLLKEMRTNDLDTFLNNIRIEEIKNNEDESEEDIDRYIEKMRGLILDYENWFNSKSGRKSKKNII